VKKLMRVANATGFELLLGLREFDSDPPRGDTVDASSFSAQSCRRRTTTSPISSS
jgi:hypothetical protein